MKKIYTLLAIASLMVCAAACGNNTKKAEEPAEPAKEAPAKEKSNEDKLKDAATDAAIDLAKTGIEAAKDAAK